MNAEDFQDICAHVYDKAGIVLGEDKQYLIDSRLKPIMKEFDYGNLSELVSQLKINSAGKLSQSVVDAVTTNETSFLRDSTPFDALRNDILARLIHARQDERKLTIWSAACSSGQEAYSILMIIREYFPELSDWQIKFICTDISSEMVERCKTGVYSSLEVNRGLPANLMVRYFNQIDGNWVVKDDLRRQLEVKQLNLHQSWGTIPHCDIIFMRNVLIYFDLDAKREALERASRQLNPDGVLFLGASETTLGICDAFEVRTSGKGRYYTPRSD